MKRRINVANAVTASCIIFAVLILFSSAFSAQFYALYLLGGFTDMIDGTIARKLNTKSLFGSIFDSIADCIFAAAVGITVFSALHIPKWLYLWGAIIAIIKIANLVSSLLLFHRFIPMHTFMNKVTGVVLFLLPFGIGRCAWQTSAAAIIAIGFFATFAAIQKGYYIRTGKEME